VSNPGSIQTEASGEFLNNTTGASYGRDAWFNALPPYIKSKPHGSTP
jgi:hypothetical protein